MNGQALIWLWWDGGQGQRGDVAGRPGCTDSPSPGKCVLGQQWLSTGLSHIVSCSHRR